MDPLQSTNRVLNDLLFEATGAMDDQLAESKMADELLAEVQPQNEEIE